MYALKLFTLMALCVCIVAQTGTDTKNLLTKLFTTDAYNKNIRPVYNQTDVVTIFLDFFLTSVIEFDEQEESLKTAGYLEAYWYDEYLRWNVSDYNNITEIFIPQDDIWKPDLSLRNTFITFKGLGSSYLNVIVSYDGWVSWWPFQILQSTCAVNIKYFPFDTQTCDMKFTAWSYTKRDVELNKGKKGVRTDDYSPNAAWDLVSSTAGEVNTDEAAVIFTLNLKRKPTFFLINIISPVILLSVLNIFTFILPVESGEKAGYSVTVFLALAVFLTIISDQLPDNSDTVSLMAVYLSMMTGLSTFIVAVSLIEIRLSIRKEAEQPVTGCYVAIVRLSDWVRCRSCRGNANAVKPVEHGGEKDWNEFDDVQDEQEVMTWFNVIHAIDFLFFWFSTVYTISCTVFIAAFAVANV